VIGNAIARQSAARRDSRARLPYLSGPQWLAEHVLRGRWVLAVAGTHGKTTTSAMLAWILEDAGLSPGFLIGGVPLNFGVSARLGQLQGLAVLCHRSRRVRHRFLRQALEVRALPPTDGGAQQPGVRPCRHLPRSGGDRDAVPPSRAYPAPPRAARLERWRGELERVLARGCWTPVERFNNPGGWRAEGSEVAGTLQLMHGEEIIGTTNWALTGEHNRSNAVAALLAARHAGVPLAHGLAALARFRNVRRRMEVRGTAGGITVYDDFAHHPTAIATTVAGLRSKVGGSRILAVLEPRSNTMKLGVMKALLPRALAMRIGCSATQPSSAGAPKKPWRRWREGSHRKRSRPAGEACRRRRTPR
jgi:UDP-N-acetylmuramate: L-alanyl-gamma-D-glutamyl-meso-diaminopimelate ligase